MSTYMVAPVAVLVLVVAGLLLARRCLRYRGPNIWRNNTTIINGANEKEGVTDSKAPLTLNEIPAGAQYDAIVVGSGIGG